MDTPTILRALPRAWRRRTAVAAAADYFYRLPWIARAVSLAFNTVPVQRKGEGVAPDAASQLVRLIDEGWSLLVFAEGTRAVAQAVAEQGVAVAGDCDDRALGAEGELGGADGVF